MFTQCSLKKDLIEVFNIGRTPRNEVRCNAVKVQLEVVLVVLCDHFLDAYS